MPYHHKNRKPRPTEFSYTLDVPQHTDLTMATNTNMAPTLPHGTPATVLTQVMNDQHKQDSRCLLDKNDGKVTSSNLQHNIGHIHHASPIWGLLPEQCNPAHPGFNWQEDLHKLMTGPQRKQQEPIGNKASNSTLMWPNTSNGDQGTNSRTSVCLQETLPLPTLPKINTGPAEVRQAIDERPNYQEHSQLVMPIHQSNQLTSLPVGIALTGKAKMTTTLEPTDGSLPPVTSKVTRITQV